MVADDGLIDTGWIDLDKESESDNTDKEWYAEEFRLWQSKECTKDIDGTSDNFSFLKQPMFITTLRELFVSDLHSNGLILITTY